MTRLLITFALAAALTFGLTIGPLLILTLLGVAPPIWALAAVVIAGGIFWAWMWRMSE